MKNDSMVTPFGMKESPTDFKNSTRVFGAFHVLMPNMNL